MDTEQLTSVYIKIRDALDEKREQHKEELSELKDQLDLVSNKLLDILQEQNAQSMRTDVGTIMKGVTTRYWASDWESMYEFIKENDAFPLLEQRIHKTNMKKFLEENPDKLPIGLQTDSKFSITVRRAKSK
tara:strand:- start:3747 stop:4139 length:393 start_codon:yes stop_codon:yes gene_type:complete